MNHNLIRSFFLACLLHTVAVAYSDESAVWEVQSDTWSATDDLGRTLPDHEMVGSPKKDKFVGMFYFLWNGRHGESGPYDVSRILAADPKAIDNPEQPLWGPLATFHHWGESIFGYYVAEDEFVLRKHAQMLADAGVDVIIFDVTNQLTYPESYVPLCRVFTEFRNEGNRTPQIAFLTPFGSPEQVVRKLWNDLYSKQEYAHLWFHWKGKPLILADPSILANILATGKKRPALPSNLTNPVQGDPEMQAILEFFTFRKPQPDYFRGPTGPDQWGWLEIHPQHAFYSSEDKTKAEQVAVGVAQNAVEGRLSVLSHPKSHGRSFHKGNQPIPEECDFSGKNFAEQWERAFELDPEFVFITGWNEWIAMRFPAKTPFYRSEDQAVNFVDQFDREYSRDIEPMKDGHGDAFYYHMIANVRKFKGVRKVPSVRSSTIVVDGQFDDWNGVSPEFRDTIGDPAKRDHRGWNPNVRYVNETGKNDFVVAKVSLDPVEKSLNFYVKTKDAIVGEGESGRMMLYLDLDEDPKTGWFGYDYILDGKTLKKNSGGTYRWEPVGTIHGMVRENEYEVAIPWSMLNLASTPSAIQFKWADGILQTGDWSDFTVNGDVAPNDRYNYRAVFEDF